MSESITRLASLNEIARQAQTNYTTARRRCRKSGLVADALLCGGTSANPVPLFLEERIPSIKDIITGKRI